MKAEVFRLSTTDGSEVRFIRNPNGSVDVAVWDEHRSECPVYLPLSHDRVRQLRDVLDAWLGKTP